MMVGKQWAETKSWGMYSWAGEACTYYVGERSNNKGYEAQSNAVNTTFQNKSKGKNSIGSDYKSAIRCTWHSSNKTLSLSCHRRGSIADVLTSAVQMVFRSALTLAIFILVVIVARFKSWD